MAVVKSAKDVATKPTTTKVTTFFDPYKASGQTKKVPTTVTTPAKTTKAVAPTKTTTTATKTTVVPQTVSPTKVPTTYPTTQTKSPTTVPTTYPTTQTKSPTTVPTTYPTTQTKSPTTVPTTYPTTQTKSPTTVPTTYPTTQTKSPTTVPTTYPTTQTKSPTTVSGVMGGLSAIEGQQVVPVPGSYNPINGRYEAYTTEANVRPVATPATTVSGVMGGLSAIEGQQVVPVPGSYNPINGRYEAYTTEANVRPVATPATTVSGVMGGLSAIEGQQVVPAQTPTEQPVTTFFDPYEASRQAQEALQAKAKADEEAAKRLQLQQNVDRINAPSHTTSMAVDTSSGLSNIGGVLNAPIPSATEYQGLQYDHATGMALSGVPSAVGMFGSATGNPYFDQLMSMKFDYDPAKDPEYINGSKVLENQVAQMMVGRGGLYSSVNQAALSSKLIEFQIALRKQKYEQYIQDRSFMLQMANTVWDRQDAAFNQYMTVAKYNADREDAMFSRQMQQEQLNLQRASAAFNQYMTVAKYNADREDAMFSRQMQQEQSNLQRANAALAQARYQAEIEAYNGANQLNNLVSQVKYEQGMYSKMYDEWRKTGVASTNVAAYFGTTPGAKFNYSAQKYTVAKVNYIDSLTSQATLLARDMNELDIMQAGLAGFLEQEVVPTTEYKYTQTVGEEGTTLRTEWSEYK